ncbi:MAG TPA: hypothetical protein VFL27_14950 [Candidatus Dormibacteraeota bacterium]|nr:hypothetical protein [Candidatus Dormibacteraeota bacterium]
MDTRKDHNSGAYVGATLLIVIGLAALVANLGGSTFVYESIPLGFGIAFLVAYALTRQYGFLVPGGILSGLGGGLLTSSLLNAADGGPYIVSGLGLGFLLIFAVDILVSGKALRWWPVIPGGILLLVGTEIASGSDSFLRTFQIAAPIALIVIGVALLVTRARRPAA